MNGPFRFHPIFNVIYVISILKKKKFFCHLIKHEHGLLLDDLSSHTDTSHHDLLFNATIAAKTTFHQQLISKTLNQRYSSSVSPLISSTISSIHQIDDIENNSTESCSDEDENIQ